ncbi:hypothetical protein YB2330_006522 [Saitoella coloradoensis]
MASRKHPQDYSNVPIESPRRAHLGTADPPSSPEPALGFTPITPTGASTPRTLSSQVRFFEDEISPIASHGSSGSSGSSLMSSSNSRLTSRSRPRRSAASSLNRCLDQKKPMFDRPFKSTRVREAMGMTGWSVETKSRWRLIQTLPWVGVGLGLALSGFLAWYAWQAVPTIFYNIVLNEDFSSGTIDPSVWNHEVQLGGFNNGAFDMTTDNGTNAYVKDQMLHIVPTLTSDVVGDAAILNGYTFNLTADGTCTSDLATDCVTSSNASLGVALPPIRSARLNTKGKYAIKYGKVEVTAKLPAGDWMWPAIWMMPTEDVYGAWPRSGEIDIMESKGNAPSTKMQGRDYVSSTLQWGPSVSLNRYWKTTKTARELHGDFSKSFNTFGLEWTPDYVFAYVNSRLRQGLSLRFTKSFYERGGFPYVLNNTLISDPWTGLNATDPNNAAPFDQEFYLILNVAVGGTNGYFTDGVDGKPWADATTTARRDFWDAKEEWYPTWPAEEERGMIVKSVKMYQYTGQEKRYL